MVGIVWNEHTNDIGDWCPFSGTPVTTEDNRCPQGCRQSRISHMGDDAR